MRKLTLTLCALAVTLSTALYAGLAQPGELAPEILDKTVVINGETMHVVRTIYKNNLDIKVLAKDGKEVWRSESLGMQAWDFNLNEKASSLEFEDLDGDKIPEIIAGATIGDVQSAMYVFKFNPKENNFKAVNFGYKGYPDMGRDFMVSDIPAPEGQNLFFINNRKIRALGKIYTADGAIPGFYYFELKNGSYICEKQEPVPPAPSEKKK